ncbi:MAG: DUF4349 domain-containing protein, partial [Methanothrix sp.]|nr:DUF4349 domain-containing protein [Methanothrix sp.]
DKEQPSGFISIRVPADKFSDALSKLRALAVKVTYENTNSQDVTLLRLFVYSGRFAKNIMDWSVNAECRLRETIFPI